MRTVEKKLGGVGVFTVREVTNRSVVSEVAGEIGGVMVVVEMMTMMFGEAFSKRGELEIMIV